MNIQQEVKRTKRIKIINKMNFEFIIFNFYLHFINLLLILANIIINNT